MAKRPVLRTLLLVELPLLLAVGVGVTVSRAALAAPDTDGGPHPERVTSQVAGCDVTGTRGAAQVTYTVANGDGTEHAYRVEVSVGTGTTALGSTVSLVNRVAPHTTVTGRALIPVRGNVAGASCVVHVTAFNGHSGHHGTAP
jgi:hypothetical protein